MKNYLLKGKVVVVLIIIVAFINSCQKDESGIQDHQEDFKVVNLISDGAHLGNISFYFLPPMVSSPDANGLFDPSQNPVVKIYALNNSITVEPPLATFDMTNGITLNSEEEHYIVNWHTNEYNLNEAITYQIQVLIQDTRIGYADVDVVSSGNELKNVNTGEYIPLKDGRTLPIKFRIEEGALDNNDYDEDGYINLIDCDDNDPLVNPGVQEVIYNGIDDDCDPNTLDDDLDQDGFNNNEDCDDNNANINPGIEELCGNGIDDDCDGEIDEDCTVLPDPIAFYPFNGNANDETGNGYDGVVNGAILTQDRFGNPNKAYSFDDVGNKRISLGTTLNPAGRANLTVSAWVKLDVGFVPCCDGDSQTILGQGSGTSASSRYPFWFLFTYNGRYAIKRNSPALETPPEFFPQDNNWHLVTATVQGNTFKLYLDGVEVASRNDAGSPGGTNYPLAIGNLGDTIGTYGNTFNGDIDEVRIYDQALSSEQVEKLYNDSSIL